MIQEDLPVWPDLPAPVVGLDQALAEIKRLRGWLGWMAVDDTDAQKALNGDPAPVVGD